MVCYRLIPGPVVLLNTWLSFGFHYPEGLPAVALYGALSPHSAKTAASLQRPPRMVPIRLLDRRPQVTSMLGVRVHMDDREPPQLSWVEAMHCSPCCSPPTTGTSPLTQPTLRQRVVRLETNRALHRLVREEALQRIQCA